MMTKDKFYIGVDIGGTKMVAGIVEQNGRIAHRKKVPTPQGAKPSAIVSKLKKLLEELCAEAQCDLAQLLGIGLGVPGIIHPNQRDISVTPNINLAKYPLADELEKHFKTKVVLGNDVNLGVLGEKWLGVGRGVLNVVGLFPGTGIGGGVVINGRLITGANGAAAEIGHMIIDMNSPYESAGIYGSLEALASRRAVERLIRERIDKGETSIVTELTNGDLSQIKSKVLKEALKQNDKVVIQVMEYVCVVLGKACISLRHIFNPDMIILGGGVVEACHEFILPRVSAVSDADPFFKDIDQCSIKLSKLKDDAVIVGAVALIKQALGDKNMEKAFIYPQLRFRKDQGVGLEDELTKDPFYIRADGRIKMVDDGEAYQQWLTQHRVDIDLLKKFCKKNPDILIFGYAKNKTRISTDARNYLIKKNIHIEILPVKEAAAFYNKEQRRRAVVFSGI